MNPKTFAGLYNGLQAIENKKKKNVQSTEIRNYPTGGTQQANTSRTMKVQAVQQGDSRTSTSLCQKS